MKLGRIKLNDNFRSLKSGFELYFSPDSSNGEFNPYCVVGRNGSGNKGIKNPIFDSFDNRRKTFYPYTDSTDIKIEVNLSSSDIQNLQPADIDLTISATEQEKADTWQELFGIDNRYKALFCGADGKAWLQKNHK